jgi:16S rRNA (guanine(1405)-N(7))-methyltransferase
MNHENTEYLTRLVTEIQSNKNYAAILPELISRIGKHELMKRRNLKSAIKETKSKLHQVTGVYLEGKSNYDAWLVRLSAAGKDTALIKDACREILQQHISTKERLTYIDEFYRVIFGQIPPIKTMLDVACGLNPLTIPWMDLDFSHQYYGWDVNIDMVEFVSTAVKSFNAGCEIKSIDVFSVTDFPQMDVVLLLKTLPCLEQIQKNISVFLLNQIKAKIIIVSFPTKSLGGLNKGMEQQYEKLLNKWLLGTSWKSNLKYQFSGETVYILNK